MKKSLVISIFAFLSSFLLSQSQEPDPVKSGSHSHMFSYVLTFHPASKDAKARFEAKLTNITDTDLMVQVNDKAFHSTIEITTEKELKVEAFIKRYLTLLTTSTWSEPIVTIPSKKSITWTVPLNSLLTLHDEPLTHKSLSGKKVVSEMIMSVVPKAGSSISDNATQLSKAITIQKMDNKTQ